LGARQAIARYILGQAEWRERKSVEYPDDSRNAQSAACLRSLAAHVLGRADDDVVRELATLAVRDDEFMPFTEGAWLISRYGFDFLNEDNAGFLENLAAVTRREAIAFAPAHDSITPTDDSGL
jgi:hypothetical protein